MQFAESRSQGGRLVGRRFDDELLLSVLLDRALPPVERGHWREDVDAGRQPLFDERAGEGGRVGIGADRRQDDGDGGISGGSHDFAFPFDPDAIFKRVRIPSSHTKTLVLEAEARYFGIPVKKPSESAAGPPRRRRRALHIALLVVGCVLFIDALVGDKGLLAMLQARQQYRDLEQSLAEVRAENADLREEAERLREDPTAIEELARRDLGLIKPGEKLFIVKDVPTPNGR